MGFAITIDDAMNVAQDIIVNGHVTGKPYFGIVVDDIDSTIVSYYDLPEGVYVKAVNAGSCAEKAGLVTGDIITALGDQEVASTDELASAKKKFSAGDTTTVTVYRNGQYVKLELTSMRSRLRERPRPRPEHNAAEREKSGRKGVLQCNTP
jgi:serine protease Do